MAEVFGAVASGAGLASLSMQLIDSAQKLKKLYNASRNAPTAIADLCFELETMSLSLRQLDSHRNASITGDELLGRCFTTCTRTVMEIEVAVKKIERLMQRRCASGRLYMAFKEPEIRDLLENLERAKNSMSFAYMSYCHSWSLSEATRNVALMSAQNDALFSQMMQLQRLECTVKAGNAMVLDGLAVATAAKGNQDTLATPSQALQANKPLKQHRRPLRKIRIALPRYFTHCVWEFGLQESENGWAMQLHPVNERPLDSFVFDVVRSGRVSAVRALLQSGSLSMQDQAAGPEFEPRMMSLLDIASAEGHLELCEFLLEQSSYLRDDTMMLSALQIFISRRYMPSENDRQLADEMYDMFLDRHGLVLPMPDKEYHNVDLAFDAESNMLLTENSLRRIHAGQFASIHDRAFEFKFSLAMRSIGWPADALIDFMHPCDASQMATSQDPLARTALHWAVKHFAYWTCFYTDCSQVEAYVKLATKLLRMGSNPHAVNAFNETPLTTMFHQIWTSVDWRSCAHAVRRWGEILVEAGLDLNEYVRVENPLLQHLAGTCRVWDVVSEYFPHQAEARLMVLNDSTLAVQIEYCRPVSIWGQWVPPGAWARDSRLPTRSIGPLVHLEEDELLYWREEKTVNIYSKPYLIQATSEVDRSFYSSTDFEERWIALFSGVQDDHGVVATTITRGRSRKQAASPAVTARASSVPPEMTQPVYNKLPTHEDCGLQFHIGLRHWFSLVYRCPFELRWKLWGGASARRLWWSVELPRMLIDFESRDIETRLVAEDDWEVQLLREQGDLDVVKRFAQRFCPALKFFVEKELEKERLIQELACK